MKWERNEHWNCTQEASQVFREIRINCEKRETPSLLRCFPRVDASSLTAFQGLCWRHRGWVLGLPLKLALQLLLQGSRPSSHVAFTPHLQKKRSLIMRKELCVLRVRIKGEGGSAYANSWRLLMPWLNRAWSSRKTFSPKGVWIPYCFYFFLTWQLLGFERLYIPGIIHLPFDVLWKPVQRK